MSYRVLVTAAGGALSPLNIRLMKAGRRHDVWVAAVDARADAVGRHFADFFATVPLGDDPGYPDAIVELVAARGIDLVLPWSDEEALALAANRARVEVAGATLACTATDTLTIMNDKARSFRALEKVGIPIPDWTLAETEDELRSAFERYLNERGEVVIKPLVARGNRGTFIVSRKLRGSAGYLDSRELHMDPGTFQCDHLPGVAAALPVIVMERLGPPAYDIDVLAKNGELLRAMPRERLNPAGVPFTGGILRPSEELLGIAKDVTAALELSWLYDYDLMTGADGRPVIIELNPRPSGSIAASILAGVPFYEDLISIAKGEALPEIDMPGEVAVLPFTECKIVPLAALP